MFPNGNSTEYRVIHAQAIKNVCYFPKGSVEEAKEIVSYFQNAEVYLKDIEAINYAVKRSRNFDVLEYGISFVPFSRSFEHYQKLAG